MLLPVVSLSSLASRVVLAQDLDTRELPLHLRREMEDYRRLEGAFTIREVHFEVARLGQGEGLPSVQLSWSWRESQIRGRGRLQTETGAQQTCRLRLRHNLQTATD